MSQEGAAAGENPRRLPRFAARGARALERTTAGLSRLLAILMIVMTLVAFAVVVLRYLFSISLIWMQELYVWMHAAIFLLGAAPLVAGDGHVRMDLLYRRWSERARRRVDLAGTLVLALPWTLLIVVVSMSYAWDSWLARESSREAGGMPGIFLLKALLPLSAALIVLQLIVAAIRRRANAAGPQAGS